MGVVEPVHHDPPDWFPAGGQPFFFHVLFPSQGYLASDLDGIRKKLSQHITHFPPPMCVASLHGYFFYSSFYLIKIIFSHGDLSGSLVSLPISPNNVYRGFSQVSQCIVLGLSSFVSAAFWPVDINKILTRRLLTMIWLWWAYFMCCRGTHYTAIWNPVGASSLLVREKTFSRTCKIFGKFSLAIMSRNNLADWFVSWHG